eukprot:gene14798-17496_t
MNVVINGRSYIDLRGQQFLVLPAAQSINLTINDLGLLNGVSGLGGIIQIVTNGSANVHVTLNNCFIAGGSATNSGAITFLGSVPNDNGPRASLTINSCQFVNNTAPNRGAALDLYQLDVSISKSTFSDNFQSGTGTMGIASLYNCNLNVDSSSFYANSVSDFTIVYLSSSQATISNCTFTNNVASEQGSVIYIATANVTVTTSTFSKNKGSALSINGVNSVVGITSTTFNNNQGAVYGGAIQVALSCSANIANSSFTANTASHGGAISVQSGTVSLINSTLTENSAAQQGNSIFTRNANVVIQYTQFIDNLGDYLYCLSSNFTINNVTSTKTLTACGSPSTSCSINGINDVVNSSCSSPRKLGTGAIVGIVIGCIAGVALISGIIWIIKKRHENGLRQKTRLIK